MNEHTLWGIWSSDPYISKWWLINSTVTHELLSQKKGCLEGKLPVVKVEQIDGPNRSMTIALWSHLMPTRAWKWPRHHQQCSIFMLKLRMLGLHGLQLDGDFTQYSIDSWYVQWFFDRRWATFPHRNNVAHWAQQRMWQHLQPFSGVP